MAAARTMVTVSWSLQRARHGEQPLWLGVVLAAMLGQIGCRAAASATGTGPRPCRRAGAPGGRAAAASGPERGLHVHPRSADRRHAAEPPVLSTTTTGSGLTYPDIRLVYWVGGNPFHHHQDLARLREAFTRPETVVVHEPFWTATARQRRPRAAGRR